MTVAPVLKVLAWWVFWHLPIAEPYDPPAYGGWDGRLVTKPSLHVGFRPAVDGLDGIGATLQVTVRTPW